MYDITSKFAKNSPLPCWKGYERVPGTAKGAKGSCRKSSPTKVNQKGGGTTKVCLPKAKIAIKLIGNLSNTSSYKYNEEDVQKIFKSLSKAMKSLRGRFK